MTTNPYMPCRSLEGLDMVLCPRCGLPCRLYPLRRPGNYRLVDPDGHGHGAVCIAKVQPVDPPIKYKPVEWARERTA